LPSVEREVFPNPPLKAILAQARFPSIPGFDKRAADALEERLDGYPNVSAEGEVGVRLDRAGAPHKTESYHWRFSSDDASWSVVLGADFVTLEASAPRRVRWREFRDRFGAVWEAALEGLRPSRRLQLGLRYINHIEGDVDYDWARAINPELLGFLAAPERQAALELSLDNWLFSVPQALLAMKHGVVRAGERDALGYLLDFDCVTQEHQDRLDVEAALETLDTFHDSISTLFRWSVTDEAVQEFRRDSARPVPMARSGPPRR
jgi:uncharacterized protein (TIGR04255 family)